MTDIHIGRMIKYELERQGKTVVWLARKLSCHRTNIYRIFDRPFIETDQLLRISLILNHDFFAEYSAYLSQN